MGSVKQTRRGVWRVRWDALPDPSTGERRQKQRTVHGTKAEAERVLREKEMEAERGYIDPGNLTLAQYLGRWLEDYAKQHYKQSTYSSFEGTIRNHVIPSLGAVKLDRLQPLQLQNLYTSKLDSLSPRSVQYIHSILRNALNRAVKWGLLTENPVDRVDAPSVPKSELDIWTLGQAMRFLAFIKGHRRYALYHLAITTGMRRGEILGLRWEDIGDNSLRVRQALMEDYSGQPYFDTPKTSAALRTIPLSEEDVAALRQHRVYQAEDKLQAGQYYEDSGLVFATEVGTPLRPRNMVRQFKGLTEKAGLPEIRFHDLRHTHATALLEAGERPEVVQKRLGHSKITMVYDTYAHVLPSMQEEATRRFSEKMRTFVDDL